MTRLIDADELKKAYFNAINETSIGEVSIIALIDNAPTVEITEEQAIDKLHETGWLPLHDKEMTERPQGKWIYERPNGKTYSDFVFCSVCHKHGGFYKTNFCPECGARMVKGGENE